MVVPVRSAAAKGVGVPAGFARGYSLTFLSGIAQWGFVSEWPVGRVRTSRLIFCPTILVMVVPLTTAPVSTFTISRSAVVQGRVGAGGVCGAGVLPGGLGSSQHPMVRRSYSQVPVRDRCAP